MTNPGWVNERERERVGRNFNLMDGIGTITTPNFRQVCVAEWLKATRQCFRCWQTHLCKNEFCELMVYDFERRAKLLPPGVTNHATAGAGKKFKVNTTFPLEFHPCGKHLGVIRQKTMLGFNPRTAITNWQAVGFRLAI